MSDGMSDSRPYDTKREEWDQIGDIKLKKPIPVYFYHYRDGTQAECYHLDIEFFVSRWGTFKVENGIDVSIAFVNQSSDEMARDAMKQLMAQRLKTERHKKYLAEEGHL